jgi:hypothetical protein
LPREVYRFASCDLDCVNHHASAKTCFPDKFTSPQSGTENTEQPIELS